MSAFESPPGRVKSKTEKLAPVDHQA